MTERWLKIIESSFTTPSMRQVMFLTTCDSDTTTVRKLVSSADAEETTTVRKLLASSDAEEKLWLLLPSLFWGQQKKHQRQIRQKVCHKWTSDRRDSGFFRFRLLPVSVDDGGDEGPRESLTNKNPFPNITLCKDIRESGDNFKEPFHILSGKCSVY